MKIELFLLSIVLLIAVGVAGFLGYTFINNQAIDACMSNSRFIWQEKRPEDPSLINTTEEPNRFWFKVCMEEKGYKVKTAL